MPTTSWATPALSPDVSAGILESSAAVAGGLSLTPGSLVGTYELALEQQSDRSCPAG